MAFAFASPATALTRCQRADDVAHVGSAAHVIRVTALPNQISHGATLPFLS